MFRSGRLLDGRVRARSVPSRTSSPPPPPRRVSRNALVERGIAPRPFRSAMRGKAAALLRYCHPQALMRLENVKGQMCNCRDKTAASLFIQGDSARWRLQPRRAHPRHVATDSGTPFFPRANYASQLLASACRATDRVTGYRSAVRKAHGLPYADHSTQASQLRFLLAREHLT